MKILNIKTVFFSSLFLTTLFGVKLQAQRYYEEPSYNNAYGYEVENQNYQQEGPYYYDRYGRRVYRNEEYRPFVGAGVSNQGIGVNVGRIGVGIGSY